MDPTEPRGVHPLVQALRGRARPLLMDGGTGSSLEDRGLDVRNPLWGSVCLVDGPGCEQNRELHADFIAAGAELIIANTHNLSLAASARFLAAPARALDAELQAEIAPLAPRAQAHCLMRRLNQRAVASARRAASGTPVLVAAGLGSPEGAYARESRVSPAEALARLGPHARAVVEAGVDLLLFETLSTRAELEGVARWLEQAGPRPPAGVGLTVGDDARTLAGVSLDEVLQLLSRAPPELVFVQCTRFDLIERALAALERAGGGALALGAYGNDGRSWIDQRWHGERVTPAAYAAEARRWVERGALIVGGCCGTGPEHVAALQAALA